MNKQQTDKNSNCGAKNTKKNSNCGANCRMNNNGHTKLQIVVFNEQTTNKQSYTK